MPSTTDREDRFAAAERLLEQYFEQRAKAADAPSFETFARNHAEFSSELLELYSACGEVDDGLLRGQETFAAQQTQVREVLESLRSSNDFQHRYAIEGELGKGGMGAVFRVVDRTLDRPLAMKFILGQAEASRTGKTPPLAAIQLARFLNEAKITGQLDHPGIVPVHEVGVDQEGRAYFTMKLVKGRTLGDLFHASAERDPLWSTARVLAVIQRVCEALAFAHDRGVIHRDLKPANVMVGNFGEVYVMDWGLARRLAEKEEPAPAAAAVEEALSAQLTLTREGQMLGTPAYMSPEQASGQFARMGPQSDVYAIGAMLYQLIAGHPPYSMAGEQPLAREVIARIVQGPPKPLVAPETAPDLIAICERAMARSLEDRYTNTSALAADLSAYLEGRVVGAYETGAWAEAKKWVRRNRALAAASGAAVLVLIAGLVTSLVLKVQSDRNAERAKANEKRALTGEQQARDEKDRADREAEAATRRADEVLRLSALQKLEDLTTEAGRLWPAHPENIARSEAWLERAAALAAELPDHEKKLAELRSISAPSDLVENIKEEIAGIDGELSTRSEWSFDDDEDRWWHNTLEKLVSGIKAFAEEESGLFSEGTSVEHGWGMKKRLASALALRDGLAPEGEYANAWAAALPVIRSAYPGLALTPQLGLFPLGPDPDSGLWEFAHLQTGQPAKRKADGRLEFTQDTGIVFVLLPGGLFQPGAQNKTPAAPRYDPDALDNEALGETLRLDPFFLSKYEMTQAQWLRLAGKNPSFFQDAMGKARMTAPVEQVSWHRAMIVLRRMRLVLPTETQWEYAARAGTETPWFSGETPTSLQGLANIADLACQRTGRGGQDWQFAEWDDGFPVTAPVGQFAPNPFGLHDICGNVWEMCLDSYGGYSSLKPGTGERMMEGNTRVTRGGDFQTGLVNVRMSYRDQDYPDDSFLGTGLRPAMPVE